MCRMLYEVCCSSSKRGLYITVHSLSHLVSAILVSVGNWSMWSPTDWTFWKAFGILATCKHIFCSFNVCSGWEWRRIAY
jgi:hypothetical protein